MMVYYESHKDHYALHPNFRFSFNTFEGCSGDLIKHESHTILRLLYNGFKSCLDINETLLKLTCPNLKC